MQILLAILLAASPAARADIQNFNVIPLGDREALLGNAGVALEHSTGGFFYNPAGLAGIEKLRLSASGTTYAVIESVNETSGGPISFREISAVPNMVVSSRKFGKWTLAFGILVPVVLQINADFEMPFPATNGIATVAVNSRLEENYIGISGARALSKYWDWGVSLFVHRSSEHQMSTNNVRPVTGPVELSIAQTRDIETMSVLAVMGVQNKISQSFRWGTRIQGESYQISGRAKVYEDILIYNGTSASRGTVKAEHKANNKMPFDLITGFDWRFAKRHNWVADVGFNAPISNHSVPNTKYNQAVKTRTRARASMGYAYSISESWQTMAGVQWSPSFIDSVSSVEDPIKKQNWLGGTLGVYNRSGNVSTGVGVYYLAARVNTDFFGETPEDRSGFRLWGLMLSTSLDY